MQGIRVSWLVHLTWDQVVLIPGSSSGREHCVVSLGKNRDWRQPDVRLGSFTDWFPLSSHFNYIHLSGESDTDIEVSCPRTHERPRQGLKHVYDLECYDLTIINNCSTSARWI